MMDHSADQQPGNVSTRTMPPLKEHHDYLKPGVTLPDPPASFNSFQKISQWPLDGNAEHSDCDMAAAAHAIHFWNYLSKSSDPVPTLSEILTEYRKLANDQEVGLIEADVLKTWRRTGLWGHKILAYAPVNIKDLRMIKQINFMYGLVFVGVKLTQTAEDQFKRKENWSLTSVWQSHPIKGGHCVPIVGYDRDHLYTVSWGRVQPMTNEWWNAYGAEAWALLPHQLKDSGGYDHLDLEQLITDLNHIT